MSLAKSSPSLPRAGAFRWAKSTVACSQASASRARDSRQPSGRASSSRPWGGSFTARSTPRRACEVRAITLLTALPSRSIVRHAWGLNRPHRHRPGALNMTTSQPAEGGLETAPRGSAFAQALTSAGGAFGTSQAHMEQQATATGAPALQQGPVDAASVTGVLLPWTKMLRTRHACSRRKHSSGRTTWPLAARPRSFHRNRCGTGGRA
jgi:hypothetical protein